MRRILFCFVVSWLSVSPGSGQELTAPATSAASRSAIFAPIDPPGDAPPVASPPGAREVRDTADAGPVPRGPGSPAADRAPADAGASAGAAQGVEPPMNEPSAHSALTGPTPDNPQALPTAVALNYCRAAFHRIRQEPTRAVLIQEQEKILNNLNLDRVGDPEIIQLYTSVLDEISQINVADDERKLYREFHSSTIQRKVTWDVLALGADMASAQFGSALRNGANSWWDYRSMAYQRDLELLKIEKTRIAAVVQKSSQFMDTFWKMAQKRNIPDRWLVRGDDLDALDSAMREPKAEVRLRVLKRMEPFMQAYPPYWYYLARTQQQLGQLFAAAATYARLEQLGQGHFRKDDMLSTGLANQAAIQDYLGQSLALATAQRALQYSTDVWEANLVCARILERHRQIVQAEDAILRNLDVDLERTQSRTFLVTLYIHSDQPEKLVQVLSDPQALAALPAPILLRCAAYLGPERTPSPVLATVLASLEGQPRLQFGPDDFILRAASSWQLHLAELTVLYDGQELTPSQIVGGNGYQQLRFAGQFDWGTPLSALPADLQFVLRLTYPDATTIQVVLQPSNESTSASIVPRTVSRTAAGPALRITDIQVGAIRLALERSTAELPPDLSVPPAAAASNGSSGGGATNSGPTSVRLLKIVPPSGP